MPYYRLTFRPHVSESHLIEQYIILLKPFLERFTKFAWSIEKDNTVNKHIELIVYNEAPDPKCNFGKKFQTFTFKKFAKSVGFLQTDPKVFFHCKKVIDTPDDLSFSLGYVNKEHALRRGSKGFTDIEISSAVEYYFLSKHLDKSYLEDGWTIVTTKNIHALVEQYCADKELSIDAANIKLKMTRDKYTFINVSPKVLARAFRELRIAHNKPMTSEFVPEVGDEHICLLEQHGIDNNFDTESQDHCLSMIEYIRGLQCIDPDEIPTSIQNIMDKYVKWT